ncbi:hypothetical protein BB561_005316 [Smittium simulii]|uniref:Uncharacterized protein n=1 Tax=Smittium simulii TaxID=133385 RepID=A0A2T9YB11_9FUNG|nr:hypothetical protein BB561_005316 [Smittium simulii]
MLVADGCRFNRNYNGNTGLESSKQQQIFLASMTMDWNFLRLSEFFSHVGPQLDLDYKQKVEMLQNLVKRKSIAQKSGELIKKKHRQESITKTLTVSTKRYRAQSSSENTALPKNTAVSTPVTKSKSPQIEKSLSPTQSLSRLTISDQNKTIVLETSYIKNNEPQITTVQKNNTRSDLELIQNSKIYHNNCSSKPNTNLGSEKNEMQSHDNTERSEIKKSESKIEIFRKESKGEEETTCGDNNLENKKNNAQNRVNSAIDSLNDIRQSEMLEAQQIEYGANTIREEKETNSKINSSTKQKEELNQNNSYIKDKRIKVNSEQYKLGKTRGDMYMYSSTEVFRSTSQMNMGEVVTYEENISAKLLKADHDVFEGSCSPGLEFQIAEPDITDPVLVRMKIEEEMSNAVSKEEEDDFGVDFNLQDSEYQVRNGQGPGIIEGYGKMLDRAKQAHPHVHLNLHENSSNIGASASQVDITTTSMEFSEDHGERAERNKIHPSISILGIYIESDRTNKREV